MTDETVSLRDAPAMHGVRRGEPALVLVLNASRPLEPPARIALDGAHEVVFGRGAAFAITTPAPGHVRVELADAAASSQHARMVRSERGWSVIDEHAKNGTLVNGRRVTSMPLGPDDLLEIGNSFFRLCRGDVPAPEPAAFRTLSDELAHELALFARLAASRVPILILGETGTGKELLARTAHDLSHRSGSFVAVNCGAIPTTLVESELFGARKGAYSGATSDRIGTVAAADGGTLFLDEIAELPETSQAALLRVLQEGEVRPLGASKTLHVDIRVLSATHKNLAELVAAGRFRDDLYARLRGHVLELPPLRARREDLGLLVAALLPRIAGTRAGKLVLQRAVARVFLTYEWPHNIRELEQVLTRAVALLDDDEVRLEHLPAELAGRAEPGGGGAPAGDSRTRLVELLRANAGNLSAVARALATSRTQVQRLVERHGLDLAEFRSGAGDDD